MTKPGSPIEMFLNLRDSAYPAFAVMAGVQLDLFTSLKKRPQTAAELASVLELDAEKLQALLHVLVLAEFLTKKDGRFSNTPDAETYFVRESPHFAGDMIESLPSWWNPIFKTASSIKTASAQAKIDYANMSQEALETHYQSFYQLSLATGRALAAKYDFSVYNQLVDVGGGTGGVAIAIASAFPNLRATVIDLPTVTPITERFVNGSDVADRISVASADVTAAPLEGKYDVAIMSAFMPVLGPEPIRRALHHVNQVLETGGTLYVTDAGMLDDSRLAPESIVQTNLWFINVFDEGRAHTDQERRNWLTGAGFEITEKDELPNKWGVMVTRKPS